MNCGGAVGLAASIPVFYLGFLYLFDYRGTNRDDPDSIKRRIAGVCVSCVLSVMMTVWFLSGVDFSMENMTVIAFLGLKWEGIVRGAFLPLILTVVLFFGPVVQFILDGTLASAWTRWPSLILDLRCVRSYIVAPVSEEVAFRLCTASLLRLCWWRGWVIALSPLFFSLAHYHHILDLLKKGESLREAFLLCSFQAVYTFIFGSYATFVFLRTGQILGPILCHMFCNCMGFPPVWDALNFVDWKKTVLCFLCYVIGLICWTLLLFPFTQVS